jgi:ribosomal protein S24E
MKILKDFDNKLCDRNEYTIEINHLKNKTPSIQEIRKKIADMTKSKEDLISIKGAYTKYGFGRSLAQVYIYNNIESYKKFEIINKKQKNGKEKESKE